MENKSMFVEYTRSKEEFISSGLETTYFDKLVFIKNSNCIYTRGIYYADFKELLSKLPYVKGIGINNKFYNSADGGGYIHLVSSSPTILNLNTAKNIVELSLDEEFVKEAKKAIYTIEPSFNSIHLNNRGKLNTSSLDVWVNIDGASHIRITDQYLLDSLNLSIWYSIDDDNIRHKLVVGGEPLIEIEEGGAILTSEDDDSIFITLESETIDISAIRDKINLYLIKEADSNGYGYELNKIYIPVTKDGGSYRAITNISSSNLSNYITNNSIDIEKCSSFINLEGSFSSSLHLILPSIYSTSTNNNPFEVRKLLGSILCIYNNSNQTCMISGNIINEGDSASSYDLSPSNFVHFTCKCKITNDKEEIYWECITGLMS